MENELTFSSWVYCCKCSLQLTIRESNGLGFSCKVLLKSTRLKMMVLASSSLSWSLVILMVIVGVMVSIVIVVVLLSILGVAAMSSPLVVVVSRQFSIFSCRAGHGLANNPGSNASVGVEGRKQPLVSGRLLDDSALGAACSPSNPSASQAHVSSPLSSRATGPGCLEVATVREKGWAKSGHSTKRAG
jgi:hypothetical protein